MSTSIHPATMAATAMVANQLSTEELAALYLAVTFEYGNLSGVQGHDKIKSLLTEADGTKMHSDTRRAFLAICEKKLEIPN